MKRLLIVAFAAIALFSSCEKIKPEEPETVVFDRNELTASISFNQAIRSLFDLDYTVTSNGKEIKSGTISEEVTTFTVAEGIGEGLLLLEIKPKAKEFTDGKYDLVYSYDFELNEFDSKETVVDCAHSEWTNKLIGTEINDETRELAIETLSNLFNITFKVNVEKDGDFYKFVKE